MHTRIVKASLLALALHGGLVLAQKPAQAPSPKEPTPVQAEPTPAQTQPAAIVAEPAPSPSQATAVPDESRGPASSVLVPHTEPPTHAVPPIPTYRPYREETVPSVTQRLIHERALYRARQRQARLESLKWLGISTLRPTFPGDYFATELNQGPYFNSASWNGTQWTRTPWAR